MKLSHTAAAASAVFDDSNLVSAAGLVPLLRLAERCGLSREAGRVYVAGDVGANPAAKISTLVAGMRLRRTASTTWAGCGTAR